MKHNKFEGIKEIVENNLPLFLVGEAGSGKSHVLEQVANELGMEFYPQSSVSDEYKLTGFIDANGNYQETLFYKAFTEGGVYFLDEMDNSNPSAMVVLNGAIANGYFDFPNGKKEKHANFRVVSAGNTYGHGANSRYVGRNALDGATLDRFIMMQFTYDEKIEEYSCADMELLEYLRAIRTYCEKNMFNVIVSYRGISSTYKLVQMGYELEEALRMCIFKGLNEDSIQQILKNVKVKKKKGEVVEVNEGFRGAVDKFLWNEFRDTEDTMGLVFKDWYFGKETKVLFAEVTEGIRIPLFGECDANSVEEVFNGCDCVASRMFVENTDASGEVKMTGDSIELMEMAIETWENIDKK